MGIFIAKQTIPGFEWPEMGLKAENCQEKKNMFKTLGVLESWMLS